jgi:membrane fusion protein (multidrug efflux system)
MEVLLVGWVALAAACSEKAPPPEIALPPVMLHEVSVQDVSDRIEATGQLLARSEAVVAAQVGGEITRIHVDEGTAVERGQLIVEIDPELRRLEVASQRAAVAEATAQRVEAEREGKRVESMRSRGAASEADTDEAQTRIELARARLEAARARLGLAQRALEDSSVVAPFDGQLARRYVNEGEFVASGTPLFDLVALEDMEVEFYLSERDSSLVSEGHPVAVRVAPFPDEVFTATVTVISPTIDPRTRTLRVKARVDNREGRLRPGLFARADLGVSERSGVVMVPEDAILIRAEGTVVYRMAGDRAERVAVTTGVRREGLVEIVDGLSAGDLVVVRGQAQLVDGSRVDVRTKDGRKPADVASRLEPEAGAETASGGRPQ